MNPYKLINARRLGRFATEQDVQEAETVKESASDLVLDTRDCLLWLIDPAVRLGESTGWPGEFVQKPLAANYADTGSRDIRDKILVQNPLDPDHGGPFILDRAKNPKGKVFRAGSLTLFGDPGLIDTHTAGDKIDLHRRYFYVGDPQALFSELKQKGYLFRI